MTVGNLAKAGLAFRLVAAIGIVGASPALARGASSTSNLSLPNTPASTSRLSLPSASPALGRGRLDGGLKYEFTQYTVPLESDPKLNQSQLLQADLRGEYESLGGWRSGVDFTAGKFVDLNNSFFAVQELYVGTWISSPSTTVTVGRKIEDWSQVDRDWDLGLWEPKANYVDTLRPVNQGLTGVFVKSRGDVCEFLGFGSPIFIPTMNPDITEKNGSLVSDSRWYKSPAASGDVLNRRTRFVYNLSVPEASRLVNNPGAGARLRCGDASQGPWVSTNYARKPINALLVKYDGNLTLASGGSQADVQVSPVVGYHRLYGLDAGYRFEHGIEVSGSYLKDDPEVPLPENEGPADQRTDWIQQRPGALSVVAARAQAPLKLGLREPVLVSLDYMKAQQEETRDVDASGSDKGAILPYRLNYTNAASVKAVLQGRLAARPLATSLKYLREFDQRGTLWTLMSDWSVSRQWVLNAGVDILGVDDDSENNADGHFLNQFRANDRVFSGVTYVF